MRQATIARLDPATAAALLAGLERRDPRGIATPDDVVQVAHGGDCFALTASGGGQCVYVLNVNNGQAWINAAMGTGGADLTGLVLPVVTRQAQERGLHSIGFLTARAGLVRKATRRHGYAVTGWLLTKDIR